jgi:GxxExxY protein
MEDLRTYRIIGAAMKVHRALGPGLLEKPYAEAMHHELRTQGIPFAMEVPFDILYEGKLLKSRYRADLVCFGEVLVELKAQAALGRTDRKQVEHYLACSGLQVGLLLNFGRASLQYLRLQNPANRG